MLKHNYIAQWKPFEVIMLGNFVKMKRYIILNLDDPIEMLGNILVAIALGLALPCVFYKKD